MAVEPLGPNASPEEITVKLNELIGAFNERYTGFPQELMQALPPGIRHRIEVGERRMLESRMAPVQPEPEVVPEPEPEIVPEGPQAPQASEPPEE